MTLSSLLAPERIVPSVESGERWPVIEELVEVLASTGTLPREAKGDVLAALRQREEQTSTGIGCGVAIPHAYSEAIAEVAVALGRSEAGIDFESIDNCLVRYVVLFLVPKSQSASHLKTLAAIARAFNESNIRARLDEASTADEMLAALA
ncbi:MAG: PTS sugar transporter subunit IIA [Verrucomicrobiales bacterium]